MATDRLLAKVRDSMEIKVATRRHLPGMARVKDRDTDRLKVRARVKDQEGTVEAEAVGAVLGDGDEGKEERMRNKALGTIYNKS